LAEGNPPDDWSMLLHEARLPDPAARPDVARRAERS
jgi:hypothetical protein